ncbi:MAG: ATP-dependent DNA helicase RecG [Deltaproteobacteria bacterium]|nr:ATP-dependent DNA helicase RecG [Deltaproteobacteria bacterium]
MTRPSNKSSQTTTLTVNNTQILLECVNKIKSAVVIALLGESDPSDSPEITEAIDSLKILIPFYKPDKLPAFADTLKDKKSLPGTNRKIVLARAQRFLQELLFFIADNGTFTNKTLNEKTVDDKTNNNEVLNEASYDEELLKLKGIGKITASRLGVRGLGNPKAMLLFLPARYEDRRTIVPIKELTPGIRCATRGTIEQIRVYGRPWKRITEIVIGDGDDKISAMWFSNRNAALVKYAKGDVVKVAGLFSEYKNRLQVAHPVMCRDDEESNNFDRIIPVYPDVPKVPGKTIEKAIGSAIENIDEYLFDPIPLDLIKKHGLINLQDAVKMAHRPSDNLKREELEKWTEGVSPAHRRLAYDEFFYIQTSLAIRKQNEINQTSSQINFADDLAKYTSDLMGFSPTSAQTKVIGEISDDLNKPHPMRRLLQGDVGSGKTMVAFAAMVAAVKSGFQAVLMAPTEILAEQHMRTLQPLFKKAGISAALFMGSARSSARKKFIKGVENGTINVAIGTHALLSDSVNFFKLALTVVDEQHRFGVSQRLGLNSKAPEGLFPHLLVMTATPIPRSLALTVHGDLDISILDELPPGRTPVQTYFLPPDKKNRANNLIKDELEKGHQVYIVCPIIEESEKLKVSNAETVFEETEKLFPGITGLLHGRMSPEEREEVMDDFLNKRKSILVATTVIEVGVNIPDATVMIIEGCERFGLAQLHQLRGRVGRSVAKSYCILTGSLSTKESEQRIETIVNTTDGFIIAEKDLQIRGPGELYGKRQAGLPGFRFGNLKRDEKLIIAARNDAKTILKKCPSLNCKEMEPLKEELKRRIAESGGPIGEEAG